MSARLREGLAMLLVHRRRQPLLHDVVTVPHEGRHMVAVVLDGYYATKELAEHAAGSWRAALRDVIADLDDAEREAER